METQKQVIPVWFMNRPGFVVPVKRQPFFTRWSINILLWLTIPTIPLMKWIVDRANERNAKRLA